MENHPRYLEVAWGCHYAGLFYTACSSRLTSGELAYIVNDCGATGVHHLARTRPTRRPTIVADDARRSTPRLMLDGTIAGYESYEDAVADAAGRAAGRACRRHRHALLLRHHRPAQGREPSRSTPTPLETPRPASHRSPQMLLRLRGRTRCTSPRRRSTTPPRCASRWRRTAVGRHRRRDGALRRRGVPGARSSATASPHSQVVPTMFVRLLKLPDEVRAGATTCRRCSTWCTPPRPARCR